MITLFEIAKDGYISFKSQTAMQLHAELIPIQENDIQFVDITGLDPIVRTNILELIARSRVGVSKYGTNLDQNNVDDFLQHAKEEALDLANYLTKLQSQRKQNK